MWLDIFAGRPKNKKTEKKLTSWQSFSHHNLSQTKFEKIKQNQTKKESKYQTKTPKLDNYQENKSYLCIYQIISVTPCHLHGYLSIRVGQDIPIHTNCKTNFPLMIDLFFVFQILPTNLLNMGKNTNLSVSKNDIQADGSDHKECWNPPATFTLTGS